MNASRLRVDSPREMRQSHSLRIEEAKPSSRIVLNEPSEYSSTDPSSRSSSSGVAAASGSRAAEVDVAHPVEGERDGVHLHVALEQPPVDAVEVLVRPPAHEGVQLEPVPSDVEAAGRLQLALARAGSTVSEVGEISSKSSSPSAKTRRSADDRVLLLLAQLVVGAHRATPVRSARIFSCAFA